MREAFSLAIVLGATLALSAVERLGSLSWSGYLSSLVLLLLTFWHRRHFSIPLRFLPVRRGNRIVPVAFSLGLVAMLLMAAGTPLWPPSKPGTEILPPLHLLLLVPLSEEFYFRGLLLEHLRRGFPSASAVSLCSLLFALLHLPSGGFLIAGVLSFVACILVLRTGCLSYAFQLHVAWNGMATMHGFGDASRRCAWAISASLIIVAVAIASWKRPRAADR